jgi:hypothetical protein
MQRGESRLAALQGGALEAQTFQRGHRRGEQALQQQAILTSAAETPVLIRHWS